MESISPNSKLAIAKAAYNIGVTLTIIMKHFHELSVASYLLTVVDVLSIAAVVSSIRVLEDPVQHPVNASVDN